MPRRRSDGTLPNWSRLCKVAAPQAGYFTAAQALLAGYSLQLLQYYIQKCLVERTVRGVFRLTRYPHDVGPEKEKLIVRWLWAKGQGAFSHETALHLHGLVPRLPDPVSITLPPEWRRRSIPPPEGTVLYYAEIPQGDVMATGTITVTTPLRALLDCHVAQVDPRLVERATRAAVRRKLLRRSEVKQTSLGKLPIFST